MEIHGATLADVQAAARAAGVQPEGLRRCYHHGHRLRLASAPPAAVERFIGLLLDAAPHASIRTARASYQGRDHYRRITRQEGTEP